MRKTLLSFTLFILVFANINAQQITFSEVNYNSDSTISAGDWIELYNYGSTTINLSGWTLQDNNIANAYTFPNGVLLAAGARLVMCNDTNKFKNRHPSVMNRRGNFAFGMSNTSDNIYLKNSSGTTVVSITYGDSIPWPKCPDGMGRTLELKNPGSNLNDPTSWYCGCINGSPGVASSACNGETLMVSEINYKSDILKDAGDWFEIWNRTNSARNIGNFKVRDDNMNNIYVIPSGTVINPQSRIVVYSDAAKFTSRFPGVTDKVGPFTFGLGAADCIRLYNTQDLLQFSTCWRYDGAWAPEANGMGYTLELDTLFSPSNDVCAPNSWFKGCPEGSPGKAYAACNVSVEELNILSEASIYPNPAQDFVNVRFGVALNQSVSFELIDANGKIILQKQFNKGTELVTLQLSDLPAGLYFCKLIAKNGAFESGRLIKL
jgi:hypothetical protein